MTVDESINGQAGRPPGLHPAEDQDEKGSLYEACSPDRMLNRDRRILGSPSAPVPERHVPERREPYLDQGGDDEFTLRRLGRERPEVLTAVKTAAGHSIHDDDHIIGLDIEAADLGCWEYVGQPGTFSVRTRWTAQEGLRQLPGLRVT